MSQLVFLHGWGHNSSMWKGFVEKFYNEKPVIFDLPGFGNEKLASQDWEVSDYAKWVIKKIEAKGIKNANLIGHSFGGKIAAEIAITNPEIVNKLILISAPLLRRPPLKIKLIILINKMLKRTLLRNSLSIILNEEYREAGRRNMRKIFRKSVNYDVTDELQKIVSPTLIIWGDKDVDAPLAIAKEMNVLIANSKLKILADVGHNIYLEKPYILYGIIKNFLND